MRYNEKILEESKPKEEKPKEAAKKAYEKDYDYSNLGKLKPMRGGNPYGN